MNWLLYIGGGLTIELLWWHLIALMLSKAFSGVKTTKITIPVWFCLPPLMLWIWLCWKLV
jgi:hypothetical protein